MTNREESKRRQYDHPDGKDFPQFNRGRWDEYATPVSFAILATLLGLALLGVLGGRSAKSSIADFQAIRLSVQFPSVLRSGELFETIITIETRQALENVTISIQPSLWQHMTINTMLPTASEESYGVGGIRFAYGNLAAGETLQVKLDGQINPSLIAGNRGSVGVYDGDRYLGDVSLSYTVLP